MDYVYDLVGQMGSRRLSIDLKTPNGKRAFRLYQYLQQADHHAPEAEAAVLGCPVGGTVHRRTLRYLEGVLANNLSALQPGEMTSGKLADVRKYVWKLIAIARRRVIHLDASSSLGIHLLKEAFQMAEEAGLVLAAKIASETIAVFTAHLNFDEKAYLFYRERANYYRQVNLLLQQGILDFQEIHYRHTTGEEAATLVERATAALDRLKNVPVAAQHFTLDLLTFQVKILRATIQRKPEDIIASANGALAFLTEMGNAFPERRLTYHLYLGHAYLLSNNYERGIELTDQLLEEIAPGSHNYGKILEIRVLLSFRTGHYDEATAALEALDHWVNTYGDAQIFGQNLALFGAYLHLLRELAVVVPPLNEEGGILRKIKANLSHLLLFNDPNCVNHYHLINLMEQLARRRYRVALKHWQAMLPSNQVTNPRYKYFHALLSTVFEQGFHRVAVERHGAKYLIKLQAKALGEGFLASNVEEIIPFESLWALLLQQLRNKRTNLR
ncbi:hypothetical protein QWY85_11280 [Neolewinella lacunae]|uniref:Tetratricopeptide repeat protein n=1 Tax=Neolewinella lacunae TaxID=1517758 RepID=A0A923PJD8_9BACT|nr:hypothetical protein [Neolewinella lacunae]MBC6993756.1 hypothetical protein [Neolewinella lacunae]MDN3635243.1 hypothetical protein [Neolewinella lacunae]